MENLKQEKYLLPCFWASALVNEDVSGMSNEDETHYVAWLEENKPGYCVDVSNEVDFCTNHDASGQVLACDCSIFTFNKTKQIGYPNR